VVSDTGRSRAWLVALVVSLPAIGAAFACTAGDPLVYSPNAGAGPSSPAAEAGVDGGTEAGRPADGGVLITIANESDGGLLPAISPLACTALDADGGCDPTAGMGCCLAATGLGNMCFEQVQHFTGTECQNDGDVFLACLTSTADSTCCWQPEGSSRMNTRYRADCAGGVEACDPNDNGGVCSTGGPCTPAICKGVTVGYCGTGAPPCQP
jgi:hypothetical protein